MSSIHNPASYLIAAGKHLEKLAVCASRGPWSADLAPDEDNWDGPLLLGPEHINDYGLNDNFVIATLVGSENQSNALYLAQMHPDNGLKLAKALIGLGAYWEDVVSWESYDEGVGGYWYCETCDGTVEAPHPEDPCSCPGSMFLPLAQAILRRAE